MYKTEIDSQAEKIEQQNAAAKELKQGMEAKLGIVEAKLKTSIAEYKNEIEELNGYLLFPFFSILPYN